VVAAVAVVGAVPVVEAVVEAVMAAVVAAVPVAAAQAAIGTPVKRGSTRLRPASFAR